MMAKLTILFILCLTELSFQQSISWVDPYRIYGMYYQPGLIQKRDAIILYGEIDIGQTTAFDRAHYEIKKHSMIYTTLCYLDLTKCQGYKNSFCYCQLTSKAHVFEVVINITADTSLSEAMVKGSLYDSNNKFDSVEKAIPKIYDGNNIGITMYVNRLIANTSNCEVEITRNDVIIVIEIPDIVNLQYQLVLMDALTKMVLKNESKSVFFATQVLDALLLNVYFQVFDLPESKQHFQCSILAKNQGEKDNTFTVLFAVTLVFLVINFLLVSVCIIFRKRIILYTAAKRNKTKSRRPTTNDINMENKSLMQVELLSDAGATLKQEEESDNGDSLMERNVLSAAAARLKIPTDLLTKIKDIKGQNDKERSSLKKRIFNSNDLKQAHLTFVRNQLETMVSVDVEVVSNRRPKHWPGTKVTYPLHGKKEMKRNGFGRIISVSKFAKADRKQRHAGKTTRSELFTKSETGSSEWVEMLICVSRHLVFDDIEAQNTTITSIHYLHKQFQGVALRLANLEDNWTLLTCICWDVGIYNNLQKKIEYFNEEWPKYNLSKDMSCIVSFPDITIKKVKLDEILDTFRKDMKTSCLFLNTYFEDLNMAIYFETKTTTSFVSPEQELTENDIEATLKNLEMCSIPLIIKWEDKKDKKKADRRKVISSIK